MYFHTDNEDSEGRLICYSDKLDVFTAAFVHARSHKLMFEKCKADLFSEWDLGEVLEWKQRQKLKLGASGQWRWFDTFTALPRRCGSRTEDPKSDG